MKWNYLKSLIIKEKPGIVCIQETKLISLCSQKCFSLWGSNDIGWIHRGINKEGGGILTMWNNQEFKCIRSVEGKGFIVSEGEYLYGGSDQFIPVVIINVYSPCSNSEKHTLWGNIERIVGSFQNMAWCVLGDFNAVRDPSERKGMGAERVNRVEIEGFNAFIDRCQLYDIPIVGRVYTCYRPNGTSRSRLDRILVPDTWLLRWLGSIQYVHSRIVSDHCALVIRNSVVDWGPKPFRTFDVWQQEVGFKEVVKHSWSQDVGNGNSLELVKLKLKGVKQEVKSWYVEVFNCGNLKKQQVIDEIEALDKGDDERILQEDMRIRRIQLLGDLRSLSEKENAMLRQKSRVQWL